MVQETMYSKQLIKKRSGEIITELQNKKTQGIGRFVHRLEIAPDEEEYLDILAQGRFALLLHHNGFSCIDMEPSKKGPDIMITSSRYTSYCEITRRRFKKEDYELAKSGGPSWTRPDSADNLNGIIVNKLKQLLDGEMNIVVIWSNTIKVGTPEIEEAFKWISKEIRSNVGTYEKLSGVILVQDGKVDLTLPNEICLVVNDKAKRPLPKPFVENLRSFCRPVYSINDFSV